MSSRDANDLETPTQSELFLAQVEQLTSHVEELRLELRDVQTQPRLNTADTDPSVVVAEGDLSMGEGFDQSLMEELELAKKQLEAGLG